MIPRRILPPLVLALAVLTPACISPSVIAPEERAVELATVGLEWRAGAPADLPGVFVSAELTGPLAATLRLLVYRFGADGSYTGAALLDDAPPRFEVLSGTYRVEGRSLVLDDGPPAALEVAPEGSLRLTGDEGRVVLKRQRTQ